MNIQINKYIPVEDGSATRRELYLKTHNTHEKKTYMLWAGFEPAIPTIEQPQTHDFGRSALGS
jgi:hypothetical protein